MPLIRLATSVELDQDQVNALEKDICALLEVVLAKPRGYTMVVVHHAYVEFGSTDDPAVAAELLCIGGLNASTRSSLAKGLTDIIGHHTRVPAARIYVVFRDVAAEDWAWNGVLFKQPAGGTSSP